MDFKPYEDRLTNILTKAGIPVKKVTLTRVTVIVELYGEKHTERVASFLKGAGWDKIKIFDDRPSIFHKENHPNWRVCGLSRRLTQ